MTPEDFQEMAWLLPPAQLSPPSGEVTVRLEETSWMRAWGPDSLSRSSVAKAFALGQVDAADAGSGARRSPAVRSTNARAGEEIVLTRRPRAVVEISDAAFEAVMARLAANIHAPPHRPLEGRLVLASWQPQGGVERELADGFSLWCGRKQSLAAKRGCESILEGDGRWLGLEPPKAMALSIAMSSVWDGAVEVVKGMVDPVALQALVYTSLATCMALLLMPEPVTKSLMVAITVGLCTYLGWSTVWGILQGWKRLSAEAKAARTFDELSAAGERFGKLLGANTARVMVMVTTLALGSTAGLALKGAGTSLPAWGQAAQLATVEGLAPALAVPAASVMVVGDTLTIGMAVGSNVVMAAQTPADSTAAGHFVGPADKRVSKPHGVFEGSSKHGKVQRGKAAPEPTNGQEVLDRSIQIKDTSPRRVGADPKTGEYVVFDAHRPGAWHGHVRSWDELTDAMKNALVEGGLTDRRGRILVEP